MRRLVAALAVALSFASAERRRAVIGFDVGTESVRAALFDAVDGTLLSSAKAAHATAYPAPGRAEQAPDDWWAGMGAACRALDTAGCEVLAVCLATTSCTIVAATLQGEPLRPALLWMDQRSAGEAAAILRLARGDDALSVNCGGAGPISAEWMLPKALWLKTHEPANFAGAEVIAECQDWLNFKCTGGWCAGGCNVATRWHCDGALAVGEPRSDGKFQGRPLRLLAKAGLEELDEKWPKKCVAMGDAVGVLTRAAAKHLGLAEGVPVAQGGADAFVGLVGLGVATNGGGVGVITGSSTLHLAVKPVADAATSGGVWGAYRGAPLKHLCMVEGGQATTGAALQWARRLFGADDAAAFQALDAQAAALPVGAEGCSALETLQGSRTPTTDPLARGALYGLTLGHTRAHVWRALLEATCLGTRACVVALEAQGGDTSAPLRIAGGATRSRLWLQMHADACGRAVVVGESSEAPLLGCAALAAALAGVHASVAAAVSAMVRDAYRLEPDAAQAAALTGLYDKVYRHAAPALSRQGRRALRFGMAPRRTTTLASGRRAIISPSLLAADFGALREATDDAVDAGAEWVHVDVCDGSAVCNGALSSLGPQTVAALRKTRAYVDVHLAVKDPEAQIDELCAAGADRITFQLESCIDAAHARRVASHILARRCAAGVCLGPETPAAAADDLVEAGLVDLVDVLAVPPGRGGKPFDERALGKLRQLRERHPQLAYLEVDGGIDAANAQLAAAAGANVLVAGSFVFGRDSVADAVEALLSALEHHGQ
ncbi:hypothetical protein M885DRAFT_513055 [Pelagophyceae sp. CCMP2097]|nr:hypothetical protein M885DRAFT_513055 [Pelagophyceae sp. CCMP2097]